MGKFHQIENVKFQDQKFDDDWATDSERREALKKVIIHLAICHTVIMDEE